MEQRVLAHAANAGTRMLSEAGSGASAFVTVAELQAVKNAIDFFYYMMAGCLVFLMQLGFAMVEVGAVSTKNIHNIIMSVPGAQPSDPPLPRSQPQTLTLGGVCFTRSTLPRSQQGHA